MGAAFFRHVVLGIGFYFTPSVKNTFPFIRFSHVFSRRHVTIETLLNNKNDQTNICRAWREYLSFNHDSVVRTGSGCLHFIIEDYTDIYT